MKPDISMAPQNETSPSPCEKCICRGDAGGCGEMQGGIARSTSAGAHGAAAAQLVSVLVSVLVRGLGQGAGSGDWSGGWVRGRCADLRGQQWVVRRLEVRREEVRPLTSPIERLAPGTKTGK